MCRDKLCSVSIDVKIREVPGKFKGKIKNLHIFGRYQLWCLIATSNNVNAVCEKKKCQQNIFLKNFTKYGMTYRCYPHC